jgi:seryl-tRNA synthetase
MANQFKPFVQEGYVCFEENGCGLLNALDKVFLNYISNINYKEYHIPALINGDVLHKCGYFESFPQQMTVVGNLGSEYIDDISAGMEIKSQHIKFKNKYLTPAACLHIYPMLQNKVIEDGTVITTKARVYRSELNFTQLTRLWDFTVREFVFIGTRDFIYEQLSVLQDKALVTAKEICSEAKLIGASDHFYPTVRNKIKTKIQQKNSLKYELCLPIEDKLVSLASFNYHQNHFSLPFNFDNGNKIETGCVGFGLERWVAACLHYNYTL